MFVLHRPLRIALTHLAVLTLIAQLVLPSMALASGEGQISAPGWILVVVVQYRIPMTSVLISADSKAGVILEYKQGGEPLALAVV